ncbi:MAG: 2-oxo acid dehydrogenase subunit E2 [Chloroflexota bacterium]|nr:2-oxo acid dehydrogenase subunit E2 [Chloroflexota bacterium]
MSATRQGERIWYSPAVRVLSAHLGIDPATIQGTGRDGRVTRNDILAVGSTQQAARNGVEAVLESPALSADADLIPLTRIRRMTADNLTRTVREVPMERVYTTVDWTALIATRAMMRAAFEAEHGVPLTYMPFILRGMVIAARVHPRVNSRWTSEGPELLPALNLGVAVSTDDGLQAPIIHHAEDLSLAGLARALHRVITAARGNRLTLADIRDGTITVTNPGPFGTVRSAPIIPPGQSAILSVDSVREIPVALNGALAIRSIATIGLTYDTRLCDESDAISFLITLRTWLEGGRAAKTE